MKKRSGTNPTATPTPTPTATPGATASPIPSPTVEVPALAETGSGFPTLPVSVALGLVLAVIGGLIVARAVATEPRS